MVLAFQHGTYSPGCVVVCTTVEKSETEWMTWLRWGSKQHEPRAVHVTTEQDLPLADPASTFLLHGTLGSCVRGFL